MSTEPRRTTPLTRNTTSTRQWITRNPSRFPHREKLEEHGERGSQRAFRWSVASEETSWHDCSAVGALVVALFDTRTLTGDTPHIRRYPVQAAQSGSTTAPAAIVCWLWDTALNPRGSWRAYGGLVNSCRTNLIPWIIVNVHISDRS